MELKEIEQIVQTKLSEKRFYHSQCVMERAKELAKKFGYDIEIAKKVGIAHDIAKEVPNEEKLKYVKENNIKIPKQIAGIMASGIISDTLILKSPTTTELDKKALMELSKLAKINYNKYGIDLLKAGASIKGKTKEELLYQDFKIYPIGNKKIGIGQISTTDPSIFLKDKEEYETLLTSIAKNNEYASLTFFVNDILNDGSYIFFNTDSKDVLSNAFNLKKLEQGTFLKKIVSRKLQIVPVIMEQYEK